MDQKNVQVLSSGVYGWKNWKTKRGLPGSVAYFDLYFRPVLYPMLPKNKAVGRSENGYCPTRRMLSYFKTAGSTI